MAELFEDMERAKIKLLAAYQALLNRGEISEDDFEEIVELVDRIDDYDPPELQQRLDAVASRAKLREAAPTRIGDRDLTSKGPGE